MYCIKCGKQIPDDARFCPHCGATTASVAPAYRSSTAAGPASDASRPTADARASVSGPSAGRGAHRAEDTKTADANASGADPSMTAPMPKIALPVEQATVPTAYAPEPAGPAAAPAHKSKTPLIVAGVAALAVLAGVGAVFAFGAFGSHDNATTSVQAVDTGSADKDSGSNGDATTLPAQDEKPVDDSGTAAEAKGAAKADPLAGTADGTASLDQTHAYANARFGFSAQIPDRFKVTKIPSNDDGLGYTDPATGIKITVSGVRNASGQSAQQLLDGTDLSGMQDVYTASDNGWYVASWRDGDTIVYEKTLVTDEKCCTMRFEYAYGMRDTGSGLVETLSPTLTFTDGDSQ